MALRLLARTVLMPLSKRSKAILRSHLSPRSARSLKTRYGTIMFRARAGRTYRALFTIVGNEVRVLRVRGAGQAPMTPDDINP